jgi:hypothetical protein
MVTNSSSRWIILPILLLLAGLACNTTIQVNAPPEAEPTAAIQEIQTEPPITETIQPMVMDTDTPQATEAAIQATITNTPEPTCTVVSESLNLRSGPSKLYRPVIRSLPANSVVTPLGYLANGLIGGHWAYVRDQASQDKGWVGAEPNFLSCEIDLASLPEMAYDPPPPYTPASDTSPGPGACDNTQEGEDGSEYACKVVIRDGFPVEFILLKNGQPADQGDGVKNVVFTVKDQNGNTIYKKTENNAAYCVFGGDAPCPSFPLDNYLYRWGADGPILQSGKYTLSIKPHVEDQFIDFSWSADIDVTVPY